MPTSTLGAFGALVSSYLVPLSGPALEAIELKPRPGGLVVGRHEQCDICLPADAEKVSRFHARFDHDGSRWHVTDLGSRWGTFVNGMRLEAHSDMILREGDLIRITPWTMTLSPTAKRRGLEASDDQISMTAVRTVSAQEMTRPLADAMLALLLESAGAIHAAADEKQLGEMLLDSAVRGTGLHNAVLLRPVDGDSKHFEIIASRFASGSQHDLGGGVTFSRTLIAAAAQGVAAEVNVGAAPIAGDISQSMVQLRINSAICVPLMLGATMAAFLYLDSRGTAMNTVRPGATAFCVALGKMASLALANLKRLEMERREVLLRAELDAAAAAQKWIMPKRVGRFGAFSTIGESRPGQYVGGDFFDIIPLDEHRVAVAVGDVCGKGIGASVLMTATQGFLHAALQDSADPGVAVAQANRFVNPRRPESKFVTLWVGVFDAREGTLKYVDAGHSFALLHRGADGTLEQLSRGGGLPVGVELTAPYHAEVVKISSGDKVMIVSDGIIEQAAAMMQSAEGTGASRIRPRFELEGVGRSLTRAGEDEVAELFKEVVRHAGTDQLSDDATAVLVKWI